MPEDFPKVVATFTYSGPQGPLNAAVNRVMAHIRSTADAITTDRQEFVKLIGPRENDSWEFYPKIRVGPDSNGTVPGRHQEFDDWVDDLISTIQAELEAVNGLTNLVVPS